MSDLYREALQSLGRLQRFGVRLGLQNVRRALENFGHPQRCYRVIQIAGTNGKGSTAAMLAGALNRAGYRTGLFTSPHLQRFTERFQVDEKELERELVGEVILEVMRREPTLTFFEVATVAAVICFARREVEAAVFETGLGGRLDATTALEPQLCVLTSIDLDHTEVLGEDLRSIAREKAGIIKAGVPVVAQAEQAQAVKEVIEQRCQLLHAPLFWVGGAVDGESDDDKDKEVEVGLLGEHQRRNARLCLAGVEQLRAQGLGRLSRAGAVAALREVRWPGRLEWIGQTLLDCAHNPSGADSLRAFLKGRDDYCLVFGRLSDKPVDLALPLLGNCQRIIITRIDNPRGADPLETAASLRHATKVAIETASSVREALSASDAWSGPRLVAGSVYLVGEARALLTGEPGDPVPIGDPPATNPAKR